MTIIVDPTKWYSTGVVTPPIWWEAVETDDRYWFYDNEPGAGASDPTRVTIVTPTDLNGLTLSFAWEVTTAHSSSITLRYNVNGGSSVDTVLTVGGAVGSGAIEIAFPSVVSSFYFELRTDSSDRMYGGVVAIGDDCTAINFNCDCDDTVAYETLSELRTRLMVRLGYAGQVANPPPGMAALLDDFLKSSQRLLYMKYTELRTERIFTWDVEVGDRLFDLNSNDDTCTKRLNALKLTWVGIEDATNCENGNWYPLISGIPPEFYTGITSPGFPTHYEIRQCIEIFPPASKEMRLRIKGHYELLPFTADGNQTTIDSELVFLWALATAKAHYGHPDANNIAAMANDYLGRLVGGKHGTKRYIPGTAQLAGATRPVMRGGFDA